MEKGIDINATYVLSQDVVMRRIEGETILVPIAAGIGDMEDELYTVNETGNAILSKLDGKNTLGNVIKSLSSDFDVEEEQLKADVTGFVSELFRRKILVEAA